MLHNRTLVCILDIWERMRTALVTDEQTVTLREVAGIIRTREHLDQTTIAVLATSRRDTLADNAAAGITTDMYHLCSCISLLEIVCHSHRIELRR